ncbi:hypothetical protein EPO15_10065 [bacterium]|nr:MAG: hypothetical protein EPO15_10065 [bacterium]
MIELKLTKRQYKALLDLVYLGDWVVNGIRVAPLAPYEDAAQRVYAMAEKAECGDLAGYDAELKKHVVYDEGEVGGRLAEFKAAYDEETFWEELVTRLCDRDLEREHGADALAKMDKDELLKLQFDAEERWDKEFREKGIDRLELVERAPEASA